MLYIQDRQNKTLGVVSDYYNDTHQMILSSGLSSYTFTIAKNIKDVEHLIEGNYVVVTDDSGIGWKFTIMNISQTHSEITLYCEDIGLELINKVMDSWVAPSTKQPASYYINKAIKDTQWEIGINEISNLSRTLKWEGRDTSLNRLLSICTEFDHAEIEFRVRFKNLQVTDYIIDIYKKRGADRSDIQLVYGDTVNDITKTSSIEGLATALMGVGSDKELPENSPAEAVADKTTFKDLTYDDGLLFTKAGDKFLRARVANQQFNLKEGYIEDFYEYDTADPQELLNRTITQLKERSEIKVNYEVSVAKFEKTLQLGDAITIIDHDYKPELLLSGRVLEMDKSYTDPSKNTLVLGNFLILYSNTNDRLTNLQNQIKNMKIDSNYMWLRYAIDDKGNGMSAIPTDGTKYFAMLVNKKTGIPSDNPADYAGHWKLIQGADGKDGIPGATGADGKTQYTHIAYANSADGVTNFSTSDSNRTYVGMYVDFNVNDSTTPSDYSWTLVKGADGSQGTPGKPGADGKTPYLHTAYSWSADGQDRFTTVYPNLNLITNSNFSSGLDHWIVNGDFQVVVTTDSDGDACVHITGTGGWGGLWRGPVPFNQNQVTTGSALVKGTGELSLVGLEGRPNSNFGTISTESYSKVSSTMQAASTTNNFSIYFNPINGVVDVYIKFIKLELGTKATPWIPSSSEATTDDYPSYIGQYTDFTQADSTNSSAYTWSLMRGNDGKDGKDGVAGKDGVGIKSTQIMYAQSTSGTTAPTTGWTAQVPTLIKGQYLWTQTTWLYTDSTGEAGYTVSYNAKDGNTGTDGIAGKDGVGIKSTVIEYAVSSNGVTKPSTGWSTNIPTVTPGQFLWTRTTWSYTDSTNEVGYSVAQAGTTGPAGKDGANGVAGKPGADGKTPYFHTAWSDSADGNVNFSLTDATNRGYLGTYTDFVQADSTDTTKYAWSLIKGRDGSNGAPGKAGTDGKTPYFHQAWADSKDGKINFSTTDPTNHGYLGTYSDFTQADSNDPSKYYWVELVGAIEIGGRNLVSGTNQEYAMGFGIPTTSWKDGYAYLKLPTNVINDEILPQGSHTFGYTMTQGATYTQAIWFETDATVKDLSAVQITWYTSAGHDYQSARVQKLGQNSYKIMSTYTWPGKSDNNVRLFDIQHLDSAFDLSTGTYLKFGKLKLEIGNKATDWSPAPEDTQGQIDSVNQGLADTNKLIAETPVPYVGPTAPTNPKKDDQWWVKDLSNDVTAFKQWDGSKWVDSMIQQSLLNIVTLNSVTLNSAVINSPDINVPFTNLALPGFPEKMTGVMTIKDAKYSIDGKYGTGGSVFHTGLTPDGWESYKTATDGSTKLDYARVNFGELQLWTYLSGSGSDAKYAQGSLSGQDTIRNSIATPTYYTNGWAPWTTYWPFLLKRNGRQITISGYLKNTGSSSSDFSIGASILKLPDWGKPFTPAIIPGTRQNAVTGSTGDVSVVLGLDTSGILHIESSGFKVGQWLSFSASYFGKDLS